MRALFYAVATFLLGVAAVAVVELVQVLESAGSIFGSTYMVEIQAIAAIVMVAGPIVFLIGGLVAATKSGSTEAVSSSAPRLYESAAEAATKLPPDLAEQLRNLNERFRAGEIDQSEFAAERIRILRGGADLK